MKVVRRSASLGGALWRLGLIVAVCESIASGPARAGTEPENTDRLAVGYEIFNREWMPNDTRSHGGDGLGPVYNDSSCVACHNSGGSGGAGPTSKNIDILTASLNFANVILAETTRQVRSQDQLAAPATGSSDSQSSFLNALLEVHAGFRTSRNVVLHKFGTDPGYDAWRSRTLRSSGPVQALPAISSVSVTRVGNSSVLKSSATPPPAAEVELAETQARLAELRARLEKVRESLTTAINGTSTARKEQHAAGSGDSLAATKVREIQLSLAAPGNVVLAHGAFLVTRSQRNPTPLFGLGLIDAIPAQAIEAMAARQAQESPETRGRASRVNDGRIGRLGWKGQVASVEDFVLNACAVELGLEVPGHRQALIPQAPRYRASGLDLTSEECSALVTYVKSLPRPVEREAVGDQEAKTLKAGRATFASIGCASCHSPRLGDVEGIYSDLLLHDMGLGLGEEGSYSDSSSDDGPLVPGTPPDLALARSSRSKTAQGARGATRRNGERHLSGASATRARISMTAALKHSIRPWLCTVDRAQPLHGGSSSFRPASVSRSRHSSSHSSPRHPVRSPVDDLSARPESPRGDRHA